MFGRFTTVPGKDIEGTGLSLPNFSVPVAPTVVFYIKMTWT